MANGGQGPPLVLLHGFPQTLAIWHQVAPALAKKFTLVMPDLPGYGASKGPVPDAANVNYSKRNTASIRVPLMSELRHEKFLLAGHDRRGRASCRLAPAH